MKIVKRDGRTVDYNSDKIRIAIGKANHEVADSERVSDAEIDEIIKYIEDLDKKRMLVEDIQDIIEEKLMDKKKFILAKKYIIYRYTRSIIRQSNTTDASIMAIMKNGNIANENYLVANQQREVMAGEASKDLSNRLLLPKNVVEAEKLNRIKFPFLEHFTEPIIESMKLNLEDMFDNGTVINGIKIESPKSFQSACNVLVEIIAQVSSCQTGNLYIDIKDLYKYYMFTYEKKYSLFKSIMKVDLNNDQVRALAEMQSFLEVKSGIQTIFYQINTVLTNGNVPKVYFLIDVNDIGSEYEEKIAYEFIREKTQGLINENDERSVLKYPGVIYSYDPKSENGMRYDYITKELISSPIGYVIMNSNRYKRFKDCLKRFNQGSIILNLGRLALDANGDCEEFMNLLEVYMRISYEGLLCRNHNLQGIYSDKSPIHWRHGAITRLDAKEKIDTFLKGEYSYMKLVVVGFEAASKILNMSEKEKNEIVQIIMNIISRWNNESSFKVVLSNYFEPEVIGSMYDYDSLDLKKYDIKSYFESSDFMLQDYFKEGLLYSRCNDRLSIDGEVANNFIVDVY